MGISSRCTRKGPSMGSSPLWASSTIDASCNPTKAIWPTRRKSSGATFVDLENFRLNRWTNMTRNKFTKNKRFLNELGTHSLPSRSVQSILFCLFIIFCPTSVNYQSYLSIRPPRKTHFTEKYSSLQLFSKIIHQRIRFQQKKNFLKFLHGGSVRSKVI